LNVLIAGIAIGLAMAAPLGPVNLIVIRAALNQGFRTAFFSGLGAIIADVMMASIAAFGLSAAEHVIVDYALPMQIIGGIILVVIGVRTARMHFSSVDLSPAPVTARLGMTFFLTATNPATALGFLAIFSAMSGMLQLNAAPHRSSIVVIGVSLGGALWWFFVSALLSKLRTKFGAATLERINRWSGVLIAAFGFLLLLQAFG
jgi:threonine/homoserine/homoserine lactone efflux protein